MPSSNPDPVVTCPFNKAHTINKSRLQHHIIKCSKNYPNHFTCPYHALHRFLKEEDYIKHLLECPNNTVTMPWKYTKPAKTGCMQQMPFHFGDTHTFHKANEDWDAEYENNQ